MKVIYDIGRIKKKFPRPVIAIGIFDGVHLGHQKLIRKVIEKAKSLNGTSMVMTFFPHPANILNPKNPVPLLVSLERRIALIRDLGVQVCLVVPFTRKFSNLKPQDFIEKYLFGKVAPEKVFVGKNFHFGKNRQGTPNFLKQIGNQYGFETNVVSFARNHRRTISSTRIRKLILKGQLQTAREFLGRPVSIFGKVSVGKKVGKTLGFPTANIHPSGEILPPRGVYLAQVVLNKRIHNGVANIGIRPSFRERNKALNVEVYIFNFKKNIYGKEIEVRFLSKVRPERRFSTRESLAQQIQKDVELAKEMFRAHRAYSA
ncbi:MAG: bifunctional riboflavin kinase/FAD synthetase [Candidatus Omnitrophota bacterium]